MTAEEIKHKLRILNIKQTDLAKAWGKSESAVSLVINRRLKSAEMDAALAAILGIKVEKLRTVSSPEESLRELQKLTERAREIVDGLREAAKA